MKFREIPKEIKMPGKVIDTVAAAEYLGKSVETLKRWRSRGEGPPCWKDKFRVWYDTNDIEFWLKSKGNPMPSDRQYIVGQLSPENTDEGEDDPLPPMPTDPAVRAKNVAEAEARMAAEQEKVKRDYANQYYGGVSNEELDEIKKLEDEWCKADDKAFKEGKPTPPMPPKLQAYYDARKRAKQASVETNSLDDTPEWLRPQVEAQSRAAQKLLSK